MSKIKWQGSTLLSPVPPVLVTLGDEEKSNILTIAWTGIVNSKPPMTYISLRPTRLSHEIVSKTGEFTINLTTLEMVKQVDFCGVRSGRDLDKIKALGIETFSGVDVASVMLKKSPLSLECKVKEVISLGSHDMFLANILSVHVDETLIDDQGKLHLEKSGLLGYAHGDYYELGRRCGSFGFSVKKKKKKK
ncbi:MAG: flavin reductase family protein [Eubacteriaceae bacterium]